MESEFEQASQSDGARLLQVQSHTARAGHPMTQFSWGNRASLVDAPAAAGLDLRAALLAHHAEHYRSGRMTLVLLGAEPLDELQARERTGNGLGGLGGLGARLPVPPPPPGCG